MQEKLRFLGLDVHAETIAAAIAERDGEVRSLETIPNRVESIRKLIKKLGPAEKMRACCGDCTQQSIAILEVLVRRIVGYTARLPHSAESHG